MDVARTLFRSQAWTKVRALAAVAVVAVAAVAAPAQAQDDAINFMRIATGPTGGSLFPMGGLIANAISNPPGSRACDKGGSCGVPGLIAVAQSTHGSVANMQAIGGGDVELALAQADVGYWAHTGTGIFKKDGAVERLRAVAMLYPEQIHLVARKDGGIATVADLKGKRVSLGEKGSGVRVDAVAILNAFGVTTKQVTDLALKPGQAADALAAGELDAFFEIGGAPTTAIAPLAEQGLIDLVPIAGKPVEQLLTKYPFLRAGAIEAEAYAGLTKVDTLSVGAALYVSADVPAETVRGITRALWHANSKPLFERGHPSGKLMDVAAATESLGIPLHDGAKAYYDESAAKQGAAE